MGVTLWEWRCAIYLTLSFLSLATVTGQRVLNNSITSVSMLKTDPESLCNGDVTITASSDLTSLESCPSYTGNVFVRSITPQATVSEGLQPHFALPTIRTIEGSLEFADIDSDGERRQLLYVPIISITGNLTFRNAKLAEMPDFPLLRSAEAILFENVDLATPSPLQWKQLVGSYRISLLGTDVTRIGPFGDPPREFNFGQIPNYNVSKHTYIVALDNPYLEAIDLSGYWDLITNVNISKNSPRLRVKLLNTRNIILRISGVEELQDPQLITLKARGVLDLESPQAILHNSFPELILPELQSMEETLQIDSNGLLTSIKFPLLNSADALEIWGNPNLGHIELPELSSVSSLFVDAPLELMNLSGLATVGENLQIVLSGSLDCSSLQIPLQASNKLNCTTATEAPAVSRPTVHASSGVTPTGADAIDSSSRGLATPAKIGIGVGVGVGILLLLAGAFLLITRKRRRTTRNPRSAGAERYPMSEQESSGRSPTRYTKIPPSSGSVEERSSEEQNPVSNVLGESWSPPEQVVPTSDGRAELEEQQGTRHEMDARSLPDMEVDDDEDDTRSLKDIERAHGHNP